MVRAQDGQDVWVATPWRRYPAYAVVVEARFSLCIVRYWPDATLYHHDWSDVHLNYQDALNRQRVLNRRPTRPACRPPA